MQVWEAYTLLSKHFMGWTWSYAQWQENGALSSP